MPGQKLYPRATVKKIVKAHSNCNVSKNADVMVSITPTPDPSLSSEHLLTDLAPDVLGLYALYANVRKHFTQSAIEYVLADIHLAL